MACETCNQPTRMSNAKLCDGCWEIESHLEGYLRRGGVKAIAFVEQARAAARRAVKFDPNPDSNHDT